jgi:hypothetical protein
LAQVDQGKAEIRQGVQDLSDSAQLRNAGQTEKTEACVLQHAADDLNAHGDADTGQANADRTHATDDDQQGNFFHGNAGQLANCANSHNQLANLLAQRANIDAFTGQQMIQNPFYAGQGFATLTQSSAEAFNATAEHNQALGEQAQSQGFECQAQALFARANEERQAAAQLDAQAALQHGEAQGDSAKSADINQDADGKLAQGGTLQMKGISELQSGAIDTKAGQAAMNDGLGAIQTGFSAEKGAARTQRAGENRVDQGQSNLGDSRTEREVALQGLQQATAIIGGSLDAQGAALGQIQTAQGAEDTSLAARQTELGTLKQATGDLAHERTAENASIGFIQAADNLAFAGQQQKVAGASDVLVGTQHANNDAAAADGKAQAGATIENQGQQYQKLADSIPAYVAGQ